MLVKKGKEHYNEETKEYAWDYACGQYEIREYWKESGWRYISVRKTEETNRFCPDIHYSKNPKEYFYIQTIAYGGLTLDEHKEFVEAVQYAQKVARALTDYFITEEQR